MGVRFTGGTGLCVSFEGDITGVPSLLEGGFETGEISRSGNGDGFPTGMFWWTVGELRGDSLGGDLTETGEMDGGMTGRTGGGVISTFLGGDATGMGCSGIGARGGKAVGPWE